MSQITNGAAGQLDSSFGTGGVVQTAFTNAVIPSRVLVQSTGNIVVVAGFDNTAIATEAFGVVRYLPNGTLDTAFGNHGRSLAAFTNFINGPNSAALQSDGKIVVAGEASSADGTLSEFAIARFNVNGGLDAGFGTGGKVTTNFVGVQAGGVSNPATVVIIQMDGKILVGGSASKCADCVHFTALARYNANGTLDGSFGSGGTEQVRLPFGSAPTAMAQLSSGDFLIVLGQVVAQFSPAGVLRSAVTSGTLAAASTGGTTRFQSDGKYLIAQSALGEVSENDTDIQLVRFNATGGADFGFSYPPFDFGADVGFPDYAQSLAVQTDGRIIVVGGSAPASGTEDLGVARLNSDGSLDTTFGSGGGVVTAIPNSQAAASDVTVQADGKIVVIGQAYVNGTGAVNLVVARYLAQ